MNLMTNPLLKESPLPYHLPPFADITDDHVLPAFREGLSAHDKEIEAILAEPEPTWENTVEAFERSGAVLDRVCAYIYNIVGTDSNDTREAIVAEMSPALAEHTNAIYQNEALYKRIQKVTPSEDEGERLKKELLRRFTRAGINLGADGKKRLADIDRELAELDDRFSKTLNATTRDLAVEFTREELSGLSDDQVASYHVSGDTYRVPLELPTVQSLQRELTRHDSRAKLYAASQKRGGEDNLRIAATMATLRAERASLLGYKTHADYVIEVETADDADAARKLLADLAPSASANATGEYKLLVDAADEPVTGADWPYWESKVKMHDYALDEGELKQYFPLDQVLRDGVFYAANRLYGITVTHRDDLEGYNPDTDVWEIKEEDGTGIGLIITDYFARPEKRGGAWMSSFNDQAHLTGEKPVVVNVLSITKPTDGSTPLLSMDEVTTLFHEFGHALHGLLSDVKYPSFSGTNVPRDWVEFPSQINENWALDPAIIRHYARHVDTGEVIPDRLIDAIEQARLFGQGFATAEYLGAAIIDLAWHSLTLDEVKKISANPEAVAEFEASALESYGLSVDNLKPRYQTAYFQHIFAGGYSAGYYSYLWAEALDADGFSWFTDTGAAGTADVSADTVRKAGQRFRDLILSTGASKDYTSQFRTLRGRDKDVAPLLARRGLMGAV
ncbi:MAG: M3 family metallopeptidase [Corynebacterium glucuronolyticum]|nr:M3 family metallopeptidase [Corynebacterium glucuronolyticum]